MSRRYTPEQKSAALDRLVANGGSIALTSLQTGIPERTLSQWRRQAQLQGLLLLHTPLQQQQQIPLDATDAERFKILRGQILDHISTLTASLTDGLSTASPFQRVLALSQLLEHLRKLDAYLPREEKQSKIVIEFVDQHGNVYTSHDDIPRDDEEDYYLED